jgi:hypothetical protein
MATRRYISLCLGFSSVVVVLAAAGPMSARVNQRQAPNPTCDDSSNAYTTRVAQAIEDWRKDIEIINDFLDTPYVEPTSAYHGAAVTTNSAIMRQTGYVNTLSGICTLNISGANSPFPEALEMVGDASREMYDYIGEVSQLTNGIPEDGAVEASLEILKKRWCCDLLPAADVLWPPSLKKYGLVGSAQSRFGEEYPVPYADVCKTTKC